MSKQSLKYEINYVELGSMNFLFGMIFKISQFKFMAH